MIKLIGLKRIITIVVLLGINLLVAGGYMFGLDPMLQETQNQLNAVDGEIASLSGKISNIKQEMAYLKENMPKYQALKDSGAFQSQDRFKAGRVLDDMRGKAKLGSFSFVIEDMKDIPNADAAGIGHRLVNSRINIKISATPIDTGVYEFLQDIKGSFSGHTHIKSFDVKRIAEVDEKSLKEVADGKRAGFIGANVVFDWMTLIPNSVEPATTPGAGGGDGAPAGFRGR